MTNYIPGIICILPRVIQELDRSTPACIVRHYVQLEFQFKDEKYFYKFMKNRHRPTNLYTMYIYHQKYIRLFLVSCVWYIYAKLKYLID